MAEPISSELIFEVLKPLQTEQAKTSAAMADLAHQTIRVREDIHALRGDILRLERNIASLHVDAERIDRRLGLVDPALS